MTFCPNCGASLEPGAPACPRCEKTAGAASPPPQPYQMPHQIYPGQPVPPAYPPYQQQNAWPAYPVYQQRPVVPGTNTFAILGFILAFLPLPFAGLVLCILGLVQCGQTGQKGRGLAVAGIVVRVVGIALLIAGIAAAVWYFADVGYYLPDYWEWNDGFAFTMLM